MKRVNMLMWAALSGAIFIPGLQLTAQAKSNPGEANVLAWSTGTVVVGAPPSYSASGEWSPEDLLDEVATTGWASPAEDLSPKVFVIELGDRSEITALGFDTAHAESPERCAKDLKVEISDQKDGGFTVIATPALAKAKDHQRFELKAPVSGRYVRLTVLSNWGDGKYMELMSFNAYGKSLVTRPLVDNSGTFESDFGNFRLQQTGSAVNGCYEHKEGLIENGGFEGRLLRFTWTESQDGEKRHGGPAMLVFSNDGQSFTGYWWNDGNQNGAPDGRWSGKRASKDIGSCPHWKPGAVNEVVDQLKSEGRARLYGILFDTDSDKLKAESKPTLDSLVAAAKSQPTWGFQIEGHTDNVGGDAHNQTLSDKRAVSVKAYLVAAGVDAGRLTTQGFGASKPVATNDTDSGRSQNRRVEVVKK